MRHCERSEAISAEQQEQAVGDCFASLAMTETGH
jgi:hypothetical protein